MGFSARLLDVVETFCICATQAATKDTSQRVAVRALATGNSYLPSSSEEFSQ